MIKQKATVIAVDETTIWLDVEHKSICTQCQVRNGCGAGLLDQYVGQRSSMVSVNKQANFAVDQQVQLSISEASLLHGAFMMYMVPLGTMFLFVVVAQLFGFSKSVEYVASIFGLVIGFYWIHIEFRNDKTCIQAKIVEELK